MVDGQFFITGGNAPEVLETIHGAFNLIALAVNRSVKRPFATHVGSFGDGETGILTTEQITHGFAAVYLVAHDALGTKPGTTAARAFHCSCGEQGRHRLGFMALARRQDQAHQASVAVGVEMDFGAKPTLAAA